MCKNIFGGYIYVRSKFSCVCSSHGLCVHAHAHSLEGTLNSQYTLLQQYDIIVIIIAN